MYRRGEAPTTKSKTAKGEVVTLAGEPDGLDEAERALRQMRHRAQSDRVRGEFVSAQRRTAWLGRALGLALLLSSVWVYSMSSPWHSHRAGLIAGAGMCAGPFMMLVGFGGAVSPRATSFGWRVAVGLMAVVGIALGLGGLWRGLLG